MSRPVLIVDDNPTILRMLRDLLDDEGLPVEVARSGAECMLCVQAFKPLVVVLDIELPDTDGFTIARSLKAAACTKDIFIVAVTAHTTKEDEARALSSGCDHFIAKPIDSRSFPALIAGYWSRAAAR